MPSQTGARFSITCFNICSAGTLLPRLRRLALESPNVQSIPPHSGSGGDGGLWATLGGFGKSQKTAIYGHNGLNAAIGQLAVVAHGVGVKAVVLARSMGAEAKYHEAAFLRSPLNSVAARITASASFGVSAIAQLCRQKSHLSHSSSRDARDIRRIVTWSGKCRIVYFISVRVLAEPRRLPPISSKSASASKKAAVHSGGMPVAPD